MSEALLTVLKLCFLALLYLFLARVVHVVVLELRSGPLAVTAPAAPPAPGRREARREKGGGRLVVIEPPDRQGSEFPLADEVTVGRGGGCGVVLADDTFVSQLHARVFRSDGKVYVEDLGSTNGTFVNGNRLAGAIRLRRGDRVQFGQTVVEMTR